MSASKSTGGSIAPLGYDEDDKTEAVANNESSLDATLEIMKHANGDMVDAEGRNFWDKYLSSTLVTSLDGIF